MKLDLLFQFIGCTDNVILMVLYSTKDHAIWLELCFTQFDKGNWYNFCLPNFRAFYSGKKLLILRISIKNTIKYEFLSRFEVLCRMSISHQGTLAFKILSKICLQNDFITKGLFLCFLSYELLHLSCLHPNNYSSRLKWDKLTRSETNR